MRIETGLPLLNGPVDCPPDPASQVFRKEFQQVLRGCPAGLAQVSVRRTVMVEDVVVLIDRDRSRRVFFEQGLLTELGNGLLIRCGRRLP